MTEDSGRRSGMMRRLGIGMAVLIFVAVPFWWFTVRGQQSELAAAARLKELGAIAMKGTDQRHIETLTLPRNTAPESIDEAMEMAGQLPYLTHLDVSKLPVTDHHMTHVRKLRRLKSLTLDDTQVTDTGLAMLSEMPLESLLMSRLPITSATITTLSSMKTLKVLNVTGNDLGDDWGPMSELAQLEWIMMNDVTVGPGMAEAICRMPIIKRLTFADSQIDESLAAKIKKAHPAIRLEISMPPMPGQENDEPASE